MYGQPVFRSIRVSSRYHTHLYLQRGPHLLWVGICTAFTYSFGVPGFLLSGISASRDSVHHTDTGVTDEPCGA